MNKPNGTGAEPDTEKGGGGVARVEGIRGRKALHEGDEQEQTSSKKINESRV